MKQFDFLSQAEDGNSNMRMSINKMRESASMEKLNREIDTSSRNQVSPSTLGKARDEQLNVEIDSSIQMLDHKRKDGQLVSPTSDSTNQKLSAQRAGPMGKIQTKESQSLKKGSGMMTISSENPSAGKPYNVMKLAADVKKAKERGITLTE